MKTKTKKTGITATATRYKLLRFVRSDADMADTRPKNTERAASVFNSKLIQTYFPEYLDRKTRRAVAEGGVVMFKLPVELEKKFVKEMTKISDGVRPIWQLGKING